MLIGLVGKPNAGKSTFFKASTLADVAIASYPFTTIKPNQGVGFVKIKCPESELGKDKKCSPNHGFCNNGYRFVPVKLIDVAGLVPEAHKGKGQGNEFLTDLCEADILIQVLDASGQTDAEGNKTENYPIEEEVLFLQNEIDMWLLNIMKENFSALQRKAKAEGNFSSLIATQFSGLKINEEQVKKVMKRLGFNEKGEWNEKEIERFVRELRKESKPIIVAANKADVPGSKEKIEKLREKFPELTIISCSAEMELALREASKDGVVDYVPGEEDFKIRKGALSDEKQKALQFIRTYLKENKNAGVQQALNTAVFDFLSFVTAFPVENEQKWTDRKGNILPDVFLLPAGSTAIELAGAIHSDFAKNFVAAIDARTKKRISREYQLKDGDVIRVMTK